MPLSTAGRPSSGKAGEGESSATIPAMARKRSVRPRSEQLVFPFELPVGDIVLDEGARLEVVDQPTTTHGGKLTRVVVRDAALNVRDERYLEAWRKVRAVRASVA